MVNSVARRGACRPGPRPRHSPGGAGGRCGAIGDMSASSVLTCQAFERRQRISRASVAARNACTFSGRHVVGDEGLSDAAGQDEGEPAALHLLVLRDVAHQLVGRKSRRRECRRSRPAARRLADARARARRRPPARGPRRRKNRAPAPCRSPPPRHARGARRRSRRRLRARAPKVWPRLRSARSPVSCSSAATVRALNAHALGDGAGCAPARRRKPPRDSPPASRRTSRRRSARPSPSRHSRRGTRAAAGCRASSCRRAPAPADGTRRRGSCRWRALMPVLPPTLESTCASSVVGICTKCMPRRVIAAAKPARSPTTPPPSATTTSPRSQPRLQDRLDDALQTLEALRAFAGRHDDLGGVDAGRAPATARSAGRCSFATFASVTIATLRPGSSGGDPRARLRAISPAPIDHVVAARAELDANASRRSRRRLLRSRWASSAATISPTTAWCGPSREAIVMSASA